MPPPARDRVFISYSHEDTKWREDLEKHLKPYLRGGSIDSWSDKQIRTGSQWLTEIKSALTNTKVAVLLVTPDFIASDFIHDYELGPLLEEAKHGGVRILWVPVRASSYKKTALRDYQAVLNPAQPLANMTEAERDQTWVKICEEIEKAVNPLGGSSDHGGATPVSPPQSARISNIPDRNPFFTGREGVLAQLQEALADRGRAALSGLGGVGKTQTALEYAHRHLEEYDYIFLASASSLEALLSSYVTIAGLLQLPESTAKEQALAVDAVKRWLGSQECWLLILDNADDLGSTRAFLPWRKKGHVLLTTRAHSAGATARRVEIREMETEEGALFLLRRATCIAEDAVLEAAVEDDHSNAEKIATQLDGLPLALDQAGAYIEETGCGLSGYLDLYRSHAAELLRRRGVLTPDHLDPVATTWVLSFENIQEANPGAAELLRFCAFLHPEGIPEEVFRKGALELGPLLGPVGSDALAWNVALSEILKYSLLRRDANVRTLEIHRLVQAVLRQGMDEATQRSWAERAVHAVNRAFPKVEFSTWPLCERLLGQAQACAELTNQWAFEFPEATRLLTQAGFYLSERGRYTDTEPLYECARAIREKTLGPEHPDVAENLNYLAVLYADQGQHAQAKPLCQRALAIREKALGPEHPDVAESVNNLASLYAAQGQYAQAKPLCQRALAIREKALGPEHPDVAYSLNGLATFYNSQRQYTQAETLYRRALAIREKALGPEHPDVATSLDYLASLYTDQGQYEKAEPFYRRALAIREKVLGPEHPDVATSLDYLASLYASQGQYGQAESLYESSLAIRKRALGPERPEVARSLNYLAALYAAQGQYTEAESLYERALAIRERALGPEHPDLAKSLNHLAELHLDQGHYAKAEPLCQRALTIREKALGPEHSEVATSLNNLASLYAVRGQYMKAEPLFERALAIREKALGPEHPDVATSLENYAYLLRNLRRPEEASRLESRAIAIRAKRV
jgi:tetratricopeptide (TPR) repeat protein